MKKKLITLLSLSLITANMAFAEYAFVDSSDFTGDAFFTPPALEEKQEEAKKANDFGRTPTLPPIKKLRIKIKKAIKERDARKYELLMLMPYISFYSRWHCYLCCRCRNI